MFYSLAVNFAETWGEVFQFQNKKNKVKSLGRNGWIFEFANEISTGSKYLQFFKEKKEGEICLFSNELGWLSVLVSGTIEFSILDQNSCTKNSFLSWDSWRCGWIPSRVPQQPPQRALCPSCLCSPAREPSEKPQMFQTCITTWNIWCFHAFYSLCISFHL